MTPHSPKAVPRRSGPQSGWLSGTLWFGQFQDLVTKGFGIKGDVTIDFGERLSGGCRKYRVFRGGKGPAGEAFLDK